MQHNSIASMQLASLVLDADGDKGRLNVRLCVGVCVGVCVCVCVGVCV